MRLAIFPASPRKLLEQDGTVHCRETHAPSVRLATVKEGLSHHEASGDRCTAARCQVHFTPTSVSWLNQVKRWLAELTRKKLQRGVQRSTAELHADLMSLTTQVRQLIA